MTQQSADKKEPPNKTQKEGTVEVQDKPREFGYCEV